MNVRTSIYDFFAYTIPGSLVLFAILGGLEMFDITDLWTKYFTSNFTELVKIVICSFIVGHLTNSINSRWSKLFSPKNFEQTTYDEFQSKHPSIEIDINPFDWQIWFASIRRESAEITQEIDRQKAASILMRGISFFLVLSSLILVIGVIFGKLNAWYILLSAISMVFSFVAIKESIKFNKWFYFLIFELIVARKEPYIYSKPETPKEKLE